MADVAIRLQAALARSGIDKPDGPFDDELIRVTCPTCHADQAIADAPMHAEGIETYYRCKNACQNLVCVVDCTASPSIRRQYGSGYFFAPGPFLVRIWAQVRIPVANDWIALPPTEEGCADD